jgi:two-component system response regulator HydG
MKKPFNILIVDDDDGVLTSAKLLLKQHYQLVKTLNQPNQIAEALSLLDIDIVLLDMNFSIGEQEGEEGLRWVKSIREMCPGVEIIAITAYGDLQVAVEAMKMGVRDFITKPWENERLLLTIENVLAYQSLVSELKTTKEHNKQLQEELVNHQSPIGQSQEFINILNICEKVAPTDAEVLITGENGTGKEMIARHLHAISKRSNGPFIKVDIGSLPSSLFESELFGHKKGAFTDAHQDRIGKMQSANGGTLFLDEIGNIPVNLQAKLLTTLQQKSITPIGTNKPIGLDIRIISATNTDISKAIAEGNFRQDLLYRINTIEIELPPLRQRIDDIKVLATHYLEIYKDKYQKSTLKISKDGFDALAEYQWPGNIRELSHIIERAVLLTNTDSIGRSQLNLQTSNNDTLEENLNIQEHEKTLILKALKKNNGNITHSARDLGIDRLALYRRLEKHGL